MYQQWSNQSLSDVFKAFCLYALSFLSHLRLVGGGGALTGDRELITILPSAVCKAMYLWAETGSFPKGRSARLALWYRYLWLSSCKRSECSQQIQPSIQGEAHRCVSVRGEPLRFTLPALSLVTPLLCGAESMSLWIVMVSNELLCMCWDYHPS